MPTLARIEWLWHNAERRTESHCAHRSEEPASIEAWALHRSVSIQTSLQPERDTLGVLSTKIILRLQAGRVREEDASICDRRLNNAEEITGWLRRAIQKGAFGRFWKGDFPRYIWYKDGGIVYEGRLVNSELGEYKGYPLEPDEWPDNIARLYE